MEGFHRIVYPARSFHRSALRSLLNSCGRLLTSHVSNTTRHTHPLSWLIGGCFGTDQLNKHLSLPGKQAEKVRTMRVRGAIGRALPALPVSRPAHNARKRTGRCAVALSRSLRIRTMLQLLGVRSEGTKKVVGVLLPFLGPSPSAALQHRHGLTRWGLKVGPA